MPTESDMMICYDARDMIKHHNITSPFQYMKALVTSIQEEIKQLEMNKDESTTMKFLLFMVMNLVPIYRTC